MDRLTPAFFGVAFLACPPVSFFPLDRPEDLPGDFDSCEPSSLQNISNFGRISFFMLRYWRSPESNSRFNTLM